MLLWASIFWVLASALVAMLPMRYQYVPGVTLMLAAPVLIWWIAATVAWWVAVLAVCAFISMYRNPLRYFWARFKGEQPEIPK